MNMVDNRLDMNMERDLFSVHYYQVSVIYWPLLDMKLDSEFHQPFSLIIHISTVKLKFMINCIMKMCHTTRMHVITLPFPKILNSTYAILSTRKKNKTSIFDPWQKIFSFFFDECIYSHIFSMRFFSVYLFNKYFLIWHPTTSVLNSHLK